MRSGWGGTARRGWFTGASGLSNGSSLVRSKYLSSLESWTYQVLHPACSAVRRVNKRIAGAWDTGISVCVSRLKHDVG